jgi:hypothetical protein
MRRLAWVVLLFISLFSILTYAVKGFRGGQITPELWLFQTGDCQQPCWHDIQPGKTTITEAEALLNTLPFVSDVRPGDRSVDRCDLLWNINLPIPYWGCASAESTVIVRLGISAQMGNFYDGIGIENLLAVLGAPDRASLCDASTSVIWGNFYYGTSVSAGIVRWDYNGFPFPVKVAGEAGKIREIYYQPTDGSPLYEDATPIWEGFTPPMRSHSERPQPSYHVHC